MRYVLASLLVLMMLVSGCSATDGSGDAAKDSATDQAADGDSSGEGDGSSTKEAEDDSAKDGEDAVDSKDAAEDAEKDQAADGEKKVREVAEKDANGCIVGLPEPSDYNLLQNGKATVGTAAGFEPFEFIKDEKFVGFDIDIFNEIAARLCLDETEFVNISFDTILPALNAGQFDAAASGITINEKRAKNVDFSQPYFAAEQAMLIDKEAAVDSLDDFDEENLIAVQAGTTGEAWLKENYPEIKVQSFPVVVSAVTAMKANQVDGVFIDSPVAAAHANRGDGKIAFVTDTGENYGLAVSKGDDVLLKSINIALDDMIATGKYAEIYAKWFEGDVPAGFTKND